MRTWTAERKEHPQQAVWIITTPDDTLIFMPETADDVPARVAFIVDACNAAEQAFTIPGNAGSRLIIQERRYSVVKDGKIVREITLAAGQSAALAPGESLAPTAAEVDTSAP